MRFKSIFTAALSLIIAVSTPAAQAEDEKKPTLSLEVALGYADSRSTALKKAREDKYLSEGNRASLLEALWGLKSDNDYGNNYLQIQMSLLRNESQTKLCTLEIKNIVTSLEASVIKCFAAIDSAERALELYKAKSAVDDSDMKITELRFEMGLISKNAFDAAKKAYDKAKADAAPREKALSDAHKSLTALTGLPNTAKYDIAFSFPYEPLGVKHLDGYIAGAIESNYEIEKTRENVALQQKEFDITFYSTAFARESAQLKLDQSERGLNDAIERLTETITKQYYDITELEKTIDRAEADRAAMDGALNIKRTQYDLGKITRLEVQKYLYDIAAADKEILDLKTEHYLKVMAFLATEIM